MKLQDKVALITGAGSGIGRAIALEFAHEGAKVLVAELEEPAGRAVVDGIVASGGEARFQRCDVTEEADVQAARRCTCFSRVLPAGATVRGAFRPPGQILNRARGTGMTRPRINQPVQDYVHPLCVGWKPPWTILSEAKNLALHQVEGCKLKADC